MKRAERLRRIARDAGLVVALLLAGCGGGEERGDTVVTFTNPVYADNFPDPGALRAGDTWYAYGTNGPGGNVPVLTSPDLVHWTAAGDALPRLGRWAEPGNTWAPEVIGGPDGGYLLYYTARSARTGRQCVGVAAAPEPGGPFTDESGEPLVCQAAEGGSIDASPALSPADGAANPSPSAEEPAGGRWLFWKNDGNAIGRPTYLYGARLTADGRRLDGEPVRLLRNDADWEAHVVEAPQMVQHDGRWYLFYSANAFDSAAYALGYATCDGPLGPCRKAPENPILRSSGPAAGPGHAFLVTLPGGQTWLLYHAWPADAVGSVLPGRQLWLDRVDWVDGRPVVRGPTADPQAMPG